MFGLETLSGNNFINFVYPDHFYHYHNISCSVANVLIFHLTHYQYSSPKPRNNTPRGGLGEGEPDAFHVSQLSFCFLQKAPIIAIAQGKFFTEKHQVETELLVSTNQGVCFWNFKRSCFRGPALNTFSYIHVKCKNAGTICNVRAPLL